MKTKLAFISLFLAVLLALSSFSWAATTEELMHDSLARGYVAGQEDKRAESEKYFRKAFKYGKKAGDWSGMIGAGMGILVLGKHDYAMRVLGDAAKIINKKKDWRGKIALAYVYLSLPPDLVDKDKASLCFDSARMYALEKKDWRGLVEAAKGFMELGSQDRLLASLDSAERLAKEDKSIEGMKEVAKYYKEAGETEKSQKAILMINKFKEEFKEAKLPPEWWEPAGETIAGPEKISSKIQKAERESADKEISETYKYHLELRKKEVKNKTYYLNYSNYYSYPYYHTYYSNYTYWDNYPYSTCLPTSWYYNWCSYYLGRYTCSNGFYFYTGW